MAQYTHIQELLDFHGLDLRSSELTRPRGFATNGSQNQMHSPQGAAKTRYGSQKRAGVIGRTGLFLYDTTDILGVSKTEIIGFGANSISATSYVPYRLKASHFQLQNTHATLAMTVTMFYDEATSQFRFKLVRGGSTLIDQALGLGTEGSPYMLDTLDTAVSALTSCGISSGLSMTTVPAAFMELLPSTSLAAVSGTLDVYYYYWEAIDAVSTSSGYATPVNPVIEIGADTYRNTSAAIVRGVLYVAPGVTNPGALVGGTPVKTAVMTKYDGQDYYRAGFEANDVASVIPAAFVYASPKNVVDSKGTRSEAVVFTGEYLYEITAIRIDKAGNRVESRITTDTLRETAAGEVMSVKYTGITAFTASTKGYGVRNARTNGAQAGVLTITVDAGHDFTANGHIAYFWDSSQNRFIQREVTSSNATTVTISTNSLDSEPTSINYDAGGVVTVLDNATISNNVRVGIYRTVANVVGAYYLVEERPMGPYTEEFDDVADSDLGAQYVEPAYPHDAPPPGRYVCAFNDQLIVAGNDLKPNTVYFSDEGPEYFPKNSHEFDLPAKVTGVHQTAEVLACGTKNSLHVMSGDLLNFVFRVSRVGDNIGVACHASMQEAMEGVMMFASYKGPYVLTGGRDLRPLGAVADPKTGKLASRLEPYFTQLYSTTAEKPVFERCTSAVLPNDNLYLLFVPWEDPAIPTFATSNSVVFVYNYSTDAWYKWTGLNMAGGMAVLNDQLMSTSRSYDGAGGPIYSDVVCYLSQQQKRKGAYNFADHNAAIAFVHKTHWESLRQPGLFKRFLRVKIYSHETKEAAGALTVKTYMDFDATALSFTNVLTFAATTTKSILTKIKAEVCRAMMISFESSEYYKPQIISGFEIEASANFRPELKE
jgi:hypothetical protein